jgi:hypothetical protein
VTSVTGMGISILLPESPTLHFHKRRQLFIRAHNETLSVVAMCVSNEHCSPARIHA